MSPMINRNHVQASSVAGRIAATRRIETAGAIAGLAGGLAMAVVGALISLAIQTDLWLSPERIAAFVLGHSAIEQAGFNALPVLLGSLIHTVISIVLGIGFALLYSRVLGITTEYGAPVVAGLVYGGVIWLIAYYVIAPLFNPLLLEVYAPSFIIQNLVYGMVTGLVYMLVRPEGYTYFLRPLNRAAPASSAE